MATAIKFKRIDHVVMEQNLHYQRISPFDFIFALHKRDFISKNLNSNTQHCKPSSRISEKKSKETQQTAATTTKLPIEWKKYKVKKVKIRFKNERSKSSFAGYSSRIKKSKFNRKFNNFNFKSRTISQV